MTMSKARRTIMSYTETVPVFRDYVGHMDIDVASCTIGDVIYLFESRKVDLLENDAKKKNIQKFIEIFNIGENLNFRLDGLVIDREKREARAKIGSFDKLEKSYQIMFPFCENEVPFSNSIPTKTFVTSSPRNNPLTGANMVVDKYMKVFGNAVADFYHVRNFGIFGTGSEGFKYTGKVVDYVAKNSSKYELIPEKKRSNLLINEKFYRKRMNLMSCVQNYIHGSV